MTGLEKIIQKIMQDAEKNADTVIQNANQKAEAIKKEAEKKAEEEYSQIIGDAKKKCEINIEKAVSASKLATRRDILKVKSDIIKQVASNACRKLKDLPDNEYFNVIKAMIYDNYQSGNGILLFGKNDLKRLPNSFESDVNTVLRDKNSSITISDEPVEIDSGFILKYNDIEQNCTFDAIFEENLDKIKDKINSVVFA